MFPSALHAPVTAPAKWTTTACPFAYIAYMQLSPEYFHLLRQVAEHGDKLQVHFNRPWRREDADDDEQDEYWNAILFEERDEDLKGIFVQPMSLFRLAGDDRQIPTFSGDESDIESAPKTTVYLAVEASVKTAREFSEGLMNLTQALPTPKTEEDFDGAEMNLHKRAKVLMRYLQSYDLSPAFQKPLQERLCDECDPSAADPSPALERIASKLNNDQRNVLVNALGSRSIFHFVQEPPGTGKTHTSSSFAKSCRELDVKAGIAVSSNVGADVIASKFNTMYPEEEVILMLSTNVEERMVERMAKEADLGLTLFTLTLRHQ